MSSAPSNDWWLIVLRGILALSMGLLMWPVCLRAPALINTFIGIYFIADGILALLIAVVTRSRLSNRWWLLADGAAGVIAGIFITGFSPKSDTLPFQSVAVIIAWALITGLFEVVVPMIKKGAMLGKPIYLAGGVLSLSLGILICVTLIINPVMVTAVLTGYLVILGILFLILGFSVRWAEEEE